MNSSEQQGKISLWRNDASHSHSSKEILKSNPILKITLKIPPNQNVFLFEGVKLRLSHSFLHKDLFASSFAAQPEGLQHALLCLLFIAQIFHPALIQTDEDRLWHFLLSPSQKQGAASSPAFTVLPQLTLLARESMQLKHERWGSRNGNAWGISCKVQAQGVVCAWEVWSSKYASVKIKMRTKKGTTTCGNKPEKTLWLHERLVHMLYI